MWPIWKKPPAPHPFTFERRGPQVLEGEYFFFLLVINETQKMDVSFGSENWSTQEYMENSVYFTSVQFSCIVFNNTKSQQSPQGTIYRENIEKIPTIRQSQWGSTWQQLETKLPLNRKRPLGRLREVADGHLFCKFWLQNKVRKYRSP